jgi:hypothetical protein
MAKRNKSNDERLERVRGAGSHGDARAGDEGVDDPAMSRSHRDDMSTMPNHGDKLGRTNDDVSEHGERTNENMATRSREDSAQREMSQRGQRTGQRANDERFDDASGFSGQGAQRENDMENAEGTGYRGRERSNTDDSSAGNPLS